jgi:hypothetical protein
MKSRTLGVLLVVLGASGAVADDMKMPMNASQLQWAAAPDFIPEGAQIAVLSGDPSKDGLYVVRLMMPAGYKVPAHNHPTTEMVTVISGDFHLGMGDKLDEEKGMLLTAGGFARTPESAPTTARWKCKHHRLVTKRTGLDSALAHGEILFLRNRNVHHYPNPDGGLVLAGR